MLRENARIRSGHFNSSWLPGAYPGVGGLGKNLENYNSFAKINHKKPWTIPLTEAKEILGLLFSKLVTKSALCYRIGFGGQKLPQR